MLNPCAPSFWKFSLAGLCSCCNHYWDPSSCPYNSLTLHTSDLTSTRQTSPVSKVSQTPLYLFVFARTALYCHGLFSCLSPLSCVPPTGIESSIGLIQYVHAGIFHKWMRSTELELFPFFFMCTSWLAFSCLFPVEISCLYHFSASGLDV